MQPIFTRPCCQIPHGDLVRIVGDLVTNQPVKLAIVGCGAITRSAHLPAALRSPRIDLRALVDIDPENAKGLAREFGLSCKVCTDLADVLADVEGVLIATPNHTHRAVAEAALKRGVPTLIEKPLTTSYADAVQLCEVADRSGAFISVGYRSRHWPAVRLLKRLLDEGDLGPVRQFTYELGNTGSWNAVSGYSVQLEQAGGGTLIDSHILDKLLYWFGEPHEFTYADDSRGGIEANCKGTLRFQTGARAVTGSFFLSRAIELKNAITIDTERYRCELEENPGAAVALYPKGRPGLKFEVHPDEKSNGRPAKRDFQVQLEEFADNIRQRGRLTVDGWFAARSVKLFEEMYRRRQPLKEPWTVS
jgi:predicted dehydrogenase